MNIPLLSYAPPEPEPVVETPAYTLRDTVKLRTWGKCGFEMEHYWARQQVEDVENMEQSPFDHQIKNVIAYHKREHDRQCRNGHSCLQGELTDG